MFSRKYFLDLSDLQYKQVRLPWKSKLIRFALWTLVAILVTIVYSSIFQRHLWFSEGNVIKSGN